MSVTAVPLRPIKKGSVAKLWIALALLAAIAAGIAWWGTSGFVTTDPKAYLAEIAEEEGVVVTESGLHYKLLAPGTGPRPSERDVVMVEYEGRLPDGTVFDTTAGQQPATFPVMGVVPGFAEAVQLIQRGGKLRIWLPPELAYGSEERRNPQTGEVVIPANSVLEFDMTLVDFQPLTEEQLQQLQMMQMMQQQAEQQGQ
ncbi:MAG: FKBP-type peptidyl-prolyl cis-trans isomerase [Allosphingosinicella sp.]